MRTWIGSVGVAVVLSGLSGCANPAAPSPTKAAQEAEPTPAEPSPPEDSADAGDAPPPSEEPLPDPGEPPTPSREVSLFFPHEPGIAGGDCNAVYEVQRVLDRADRSGAAALAALLAGPTDAERRDHQVSHPFTRTRFTHRPELLDLADYLVGVEVKGEVAYVDFSEEGALEYVLYDAACAAGAVNTAIARTLIAATGASRVRYRVGGELVSNEGGA